MPKKHISSLISQSFGKFASKEFPRWFQRIVNTTYVRLMGLDLSEFYHQNQYKSLNKLFTRKLRLDRKFSDNSKDFISPCDSWISELGNINDTDALQIKGMRYEAQAVLGNNFTQDEKDIIKNGQFINFYLSPKDYHRYHIPCDLKVLKAVHIPGKFYPVNIKSLKMRVNLFEENERVVLLCETKENKKFYMVLVSALNVGVMKVDFEPKIQTNAEANREQVYEFKNMELKKGDDFGCFEMGSTIVILAQKDMLELNIKQNDNVKFGQTIASCL
ncbi:MAG: phosphatidylserine decarboxylase [Campylobacterota bacterium]|nr:phosphatidylserine decarboxylase [Campylobacterota bacterium]